MRKEGLIHEIVTALIPNGSHLRVITQSEFFGGHWKLALCSSREPYCNICASKTLNIRKEVNPFFCVAVSILSHRKTSK